ncbi:MAG: UbiA-like polyprenyltransferase [Terrimicrobiaceae bacterium]
MIGAGHLEPGQSLKSAAKKSADFLTFIRFSHTVFALPFALGAMVVAAHGLPSWHVLGLALLAMIFARTAAMTFNRLADWEIDKRNPRTMGRHRLASKKMAVLACGVSSLFFIGVCAWLNPLCLALSPVALGIVFFYSFTKRFTHLAQFFLGLALAVAPVGGWIAVTGQIAWAPLWLAASVLFWVAGFDMVYAMQDYEVDQMEGLHSMVVALGISRARKAAILLHGISFVLLAGFGWVAGLGGLFFVSLIGIAALLVWEHCLARRGDTQALNQAFFQVNAAVGIFFVAGTLADTLIN